MARKYATPINMQQLEVLQLRLEQRAGDPTTGVEGQVYWNTVTDKIRVCTVTGSPGTWVDELVGPITSADIADGTIVNADVNAAAAIAYAKLALTAAIVNGDIAAAAAIAYSKLNLASAIVNADIAPAAAIALSKLATDPLARANHTGTQLAATISNFDTQVRTSRLDQMAAPTAAVVFNGQRQTGVADGIAATDGVTKQQLDAVSVGLDVKASVRVASAGANISLAAPGATIDGVAMVAGDRVLLKDQTAPAENGIWVWNGAAAAMTRATDADTSAEVTPGLFTFVEDGTVPNADSGWVLTTNAPIVLGTTGLVFAQFSGAGQITAGAGLTKSGNSLDVGAAAGITVAADTVGVATGGVTNAMLAGAIDLLTKVTGALPLANGGTAATSAAAARTNLVTPGRYDNAATHASTASLLIAAATHGLGAGRNKLVQVVEEATGDVVVTDVNIAANGDVTIGWATAPAANTHRVLIAGW